MINCSSNGSRVLTRFHFLRSKLYKWYYRAACPQLSAIKTLTNNHKTSSSRPRHLLQRQNTQRSINCSQIHTPCVESTQQPVYKPDQPSDCNEKVTYGLFKKKLRINCTTFTSNISCSHYKLIDEGNASISCNSSTSNPPMVGATIPFNGFQTEYSRLCRIDSLKKINK